MQTRPHFLDKRCTFTVDRWPWVTCSLCISCIAIFYAGIDSSNFAYKINNPSAWATPFLYAFFHTNSSHLWSNMIIFLLAGIAFEATENSWRLFITVMVSTPLAAGGQGFVSENGVIGASGFVYAVIVYQLALVLKNFREMRYRPYAKSLYISVRSVISAATTRLIFGLVLLVAEIVSTRYNNNISHGAHALGAASGILLSMAMGSNVVIDVLEIISVFLGCIGLFCLIIANVATYQFAVTLWAWPFTILAFSISDFEYRRWFKKYMRINSMS